MLDRYVLCISLACCLLVGRWSPAAEDLLCDTEGRPSLNRWQAYHEEPVGELGDVWQLNDGILSCEGRPRGYLYTKTPYTDFSLRLQWRWPPDSKPGSGGVLIRMTGEHQVWPKCLEAQLNAGSEGDFVGLLGYGLTGPADRLEQLTHEKFGKLTFLRRSEAAVKPAGQWNQLEIVAAGETVTIRINGRLVNRATGCDVTAGPLLLTAENDAIQFREVLLESADRRR